MCDHVHCSRSLASDHLTLETGQGRNVRGRDTELYTLDTVLLTSYKLLYWPLYSRDGRSAPVSPVYLLSSQYYTVWTVPGCRPRLAPPLGGAGPRCGPGLQLAEML